MIKDAQTRGYVVGFTDLGNTDDFTTEMLEWRIAHVRIIHPIQFLDSVTDPECLSWIPDPNFFIPNPVLKRFRIAGPDPHRRF